MHYIGTLISILVLACTFSFFTYQSFHFLFPHSPPPFHSFYFYPLWFSFLFYFCYFTLFHFFFVSSFTFLLSLLFFFLFHPSYHFFIPLYFLTLSFLCSLFTCFLCFMPNYLTSKIATFMSTCGDICFRTKTCKALMPY